MEKEARASRGYRGILFHLEKKNHSGVTDRLQARVYLCIQNLNYSELIIKCCDPYDTRPFCPGYPGPPGSPFLPGPPTSPFPPGNPGIPERPGSPGKPISPGRPLSPEARETKCCCLCQEMLEVGNCDDKQ